MTKTTFAGATVLITGAPSGIGRAAAVLAAERGSRLVLTDLGDDGLDGTVALLPDPSVVVHRAVFDLRDQAALDAFAADVHRQVPAVDVVMNVAGISTWGRIQDLDPQHWRDCVEIDLMAPVAVLSAFVPPMIERGTGGHIVNVSSAAGLFGLPLHAPYSAAKFGLRGVSEVLRFDLEQHDIGVSLVCPGAVKTPLVGTVNIVGVDRDHPKVQKAIQGFERHAVSPEHAAEAMLRGVERGTYLVFTSRDIRAGHLLQRYLPWGYRRAMRSLNSRFSRIIESTTR